MAGLVPAIQTRLAAPKDLGGAAYDFLGDGCLWIAGTSPAMTISVDDCVSNPAPSA